MRVKATTHQALVPALLAFVVTVGCSNTASVANNSSATNTSATANPVTAKPSVNVASATATAASAPAADPEQAQKFARWITDFSASARAQGISEATLKLAFAEVHYLPRVIEQDTTQPEFTRTVWDYLDGALSPQRVARGQERLAQVRDIVDPQAAHYGVPAQVLAAIWGMESSYGIYMGDIPAIDALATLGFQGRREQWARGQLIAALKILQNGDVDHAHMVGSWAGAMGQTQFLPSVYLAYAVDADGDGRRDIWTSVPDVLASTANYLKASGWQSGQPWGVPVRLPKGFDYTHADPDVRQSTEQWLAEGVRPADSSSKGSALPALADASILLPAGARGPAFLVGANFRTILRYNNATSYALGVCLLSDRLAGAPALPLTWPRDLHMLNRAQVLALQTALNAHGFDSGTPDGMAGPSTQRAIRRYQLSQAQPADGFATLELLQRLQETPQRAP